MLTTNRRNPSFGGSPLKKGSSSRSAISSLRAKNFSSIIDFSKTQQKSNIDLELDPEMQIVTDRLEIDLNIGDFSHLPTSFLKLSMKAISLFTEKKLSDNNIEEIIGFRNQILFWNEALMEKDQVKFKTPKYIYKPKKFLFPPQISFLKSESPPAFVDKSYFFFFQALKKYYIK